jgi:hypothetical protein
MHANFCDRSYWARPNSFQPRWPGHVFGIHLKPGQELHVREHQFLAATGNVDYNYERVKGLSNMLFGGQVSSSISSTVQIARVSSGCMGMETCSKKCLYLESRLTSSRVDGFTRTRQFGWKRTSKRYPLDFCQA